MKLLAEARETLRKIVRPPRGQVEEVLREHECVGGTYWDNERKTTFSKCRCGARCYLIEQPDHAAHLGDLLEAL